MDDLYKLHDIGKGGRVVGRALIGSPPEMTTILDFTGLRGSASNLYYALVFQMLNQAYTIKKVDEWMQVTPEYTEFYNITLEQKHKLEGAIKAGLTSATQAVADFELLAHDMRRYREILDYFIQARKKGEQHVLRSFFVDRVDNFTGEGYSLISIVKRWPTIISDFIRMEEGWDDVKTIRQKLDVTQAEATVLRTKNELFKEWKTMFLPEVKQRYARIRNLVNARKKSVEEYRKWLKPYIVNYRLMKESLETTPGKSLSDPLNTPGFGQSQATTGIRLWAWKPFPVSEIQKREPELSQKGFVIDPYDRFVREWQGKIEARYGVAFTEQVAREIAKQLEPNNLYYVFFDLTMEMTLIRTPPPEGAELDDMAITCRTMIMSQNALLLHLMELQARERAMENYIDEIIGAKEEDIYQSVEKEFAEEKPQRLAGLRKAHQKLRWAGAKIRPALTWVFRLFFKEGPYEINFDERIGKIYFRGVGKYYTQFVEMAKKNMKVE